MEELLWEHQISVINISKEELVFVRSETSFVDVRLAVKNIQKAIEK